MILPTLLGVLATASQLAAQPDPVEPPILSATDEEADPDTQLPERVEVEPAARDDEIRDRLIRILLATDWFIDPRVTVDEGIVILEGIGNDERSREWAGDIARNAEGVVTVVNRMEVVTPPSGTSARQGKRSARSDGVSSRICR